jgi:Ig-like domain CHU_C associated
MGNRAVVCAMLILFSVGASAQTTTPTTPTFTGSFQLQDTTQFFGVTKTPQNPLNQGNATFEPVVFTDNNNVPLSLSFEVIGTAATNTEDWIFAFTNGGDPAPPGTYTIGTNSPVTATLHLFFGNTCDAQAGTVSVGAASNDRTTGVTNQLQITFNLDCGGGSTVSGSFSYQLTSGGGGGGGGGGTGGGGGGGSVSTGSGLPPGLGNFPIGGGTSTPTTPTTPPAPALSLSTPSAVTQISSGESAALSLTTFGNETFASDVTFSASGPPGLTFAFSPTTIASPGSGTTTLTIGTTDGLQTGLQRVEVIAQGANGVIARGAFNVFVNCDPPMILGIDQPRSTSIGSGNTAQLTVKPTGSGPFTYQWYEGHRGSLVFPVSGANGATLTTSNLTAGTEFWVRVANPCGAVDSQNATIFVNP